MKIEWYVFRSWSSHEKETTPQDPWVHTTHGTLAGEQQKRKGQKTHTHIQTRKRKRDMKNAVEFKRKYSQQAWGPVWIDDQNHKTGDPWPASLARDGWRPGSSSSRTSLGRLWPPPTLPSLLLLSSEDELLLLVPDFGMLLSKIDHSWSWPPLGVPRAWIFHCSWTACMRTLSQSVQRLLINQFVLRASPDESPVSLFQSHFSWMNGNYNNRGKNINIYIKKKEGKL